MEREAMPRSHSPVSDLMNVSSISSYILHELVGSTCLWNSVCSCCMNIATYSFFLVGFGNWLTNSMGEYSAPELLELGNTFFKSYIYLYIGHVHRSQSTACRSWFSLPPYGFWGLDSAHRDWGQVPWFAEPSSSQWIPDQLRKASKNLILEEEKEEEYISKEGRK